MVNSSKGKKAPQKNNIIKTVLLTVFLFFIGFALISPNFQKKDVKNVPLSQVIEEVKSGKIKRIEQSGRDLSITPNGEDKPTMSSRIDEGSSAKEQGIDITKTEFVINKPSEGSALLVNVIAPIAIPVIFFAVLLYFMARQAQSQGNQAMSFGKSRARIVNNGKDKVTFKDVAGNAESKQDLEEVVEFLKFPKKFEAVGARIPKGVLLVGPPGTGKTLLARAVAGEANVPFFSISGSEFVEMFVGVGASRVRDLFNKAKKNAPCIIFIDEIDAVGRRRGSGTGSGHDEREQTLNQILVEMDGFEQGANVIVLAATNRADVLDPALLRPGRFDRQVHINLPERKDRLAILKVHFKNKPADSSVKLDDLAAKSAGSSGADLANIANESAIVAARNNRKTINNSDLTEAFEKIAIGPERSSKVMNDKEKAITAYHEAGHAIVGHVLPDSDMVHKVTIIPRGGTGGVTWFIPPEDRSYHSIIEYKDVLARMLGGRIAEKVVFGDDFVTTGAGNDLQKATDLAREMVIEQGMGDKLRNQVFHEDNSGMLLDRMVHTKPYSEATQKLIDSEIEALITEAAKRAESVIQTNRKQLDTLKEELFKQETIDADSVADILKDTVLPKDAKLY